jgi:hypothetical protein
MQIKQLETPILINGKNEIIDGQHRFTTCKKLNLPIFYIVKTEYGRKETKILNTISKNWTPLDFLTAYADLRFPNYLKLKEFMKDTKLTLSESRLFINLGASGSKGTIDFKTGNMEIKDMAKSYKFFQYYQDFKETEPYGRIAFARSLMAIFNNDNYDHKVMKSKLGYKGYEVRRRSSSIEYHRLIENVYNYNNRNPKKIY